MAGEKISAMTKEDRIALAGGTECLCAAGGYGEGTPRDHPKQEESYGR